MNHRFGWAALVAVGMLAGFALSSYQRGDMGPRAAVAAEPEAQAEAENPHDADVLSELKEIKTQLKEINTLLHTGSIKTIVLINPDAKPG
jgi:hypothetical protein